MQNPWEEAVGQADDAYRAIDRIADLCGDWMPLAAGLGQECNDALRQISVIRYALLDTAEVWKENFPEEQ